MKNKRKIYVNIVVVSLFVASLAVAPFSTFAASTSTRKHTPSSSQNTKYPIGRNISGNVTAISGTTITIQGKKNNLSYSIDASNATFPNQYGAIEDISSIQIGDSVIARGDVSGITNITANTIVDLSFIERTVFTGNITSINGSVFAIVNKKHIVYSVDASSAVFKKGSTVVSVKNIMAGDSVVVFGTSNGNNVKATSIKLVARPIVKKK